MAPDSTVVGLVLGVLVAGTALAQPPMPNRGPLIESSPGLRPQPMPQGAFPETPPAVGEAEQRLAQCVAVNRSAFEQFRAAGSVVADVYRRDELKKTGERLEWKLATLENFKNSERTLAQSFARYKAVGGTASTPESVVRTGDPCRDRSEKLNAAVREAYGSKPSPVTRSGTLIAPPRGDR